MPRDLVWVLEWVRDGVARFALGDDGDEPAQVEAQVSKLIRQGGCKLVAGAGYRMWQRPERHLLIERVDDGARDRSDRSEPTGEAGPAHVGGLGGLGLRPSLDGQRRTFDLPLTQGGRLSRGWMG